MIFSCKLKGVDLSNLEQVSAVVVVIYCNHRYPLEKEKPDVHVLADFLNWY